MAGAATGSSAVGADQGYGGGKRKPKPSKQRPVKLTSKTKF